MVKVKGFQGLTLKSQLYGQILHKNLEYMDDCQLFKSFNVQDYLMKGLLSPQQQQFTYLYEQQFLGLLTLGLLVELSLIDYKNNKIKKHQKTLKRPHLNEKTYAKNHVGPVIVGHQFNQAVDNFLHKLHDTVEPFAVWSTADGRIHKLRRVSSLSQTGELQKYFEQIQNFYILDGHHRFEAGLQYMESLGQNIKQKNKWIQGLIYSTKYIRSYPQFRKLIHSDHINIIRNIKFKSELSVKQVQFYDPNDCQSEIVLLYDEKFYQIKRVNENNCGIQNKTGVEKLDQILKEALECVQSKCQNPIKFIPSIMFDMKDLSLHTDPVFLVKSPAITEIFAKADRQQILPPKSTWLEPKPCLHMVIRTPY